MWKGLSGVARNFQDVQEFSKSVPEGARMCEELQGVSRMCQELSGNARRCQEMSEGVVNCQKVSGHARRRQEVLGMPGIVISCQDVPGVNELMNKLGNECGKLFIYSMFTQ